MFRRLLNDRLQYFMQPEESDNNQMFNFEFQQAMLNIYGKYLNRTYWYIVR